MGCVGFSGRGREGTKAGENFLLPLPCGPGEEEDLQCHSQQHRFSPHFFLQCTKTVSFCTKYVVLFKRKWCKKQVKFQISL
jgi:hypothetical protein